MKVTFPNIGRVFLFYVSNFFQVFLIFVKHVHIFQLQGMILWLLSNSEVSHSRYLVLAPWDLVKWSPVSEIPIISPITLVFCSILFKSFDKLLTFVRCKDNFGHLGLISVCFIIGGGLERCFRTRYHIFPMLIIRVTTHVIILLWEICTAFNALLLLAQYYHY